MNARDDMEAPDAGVRLDPTGAARSSSGAGPKGVPGSSSGSGPAVPDPRDGAWAITVPGDGIRFAGLRWGPTAVGPGTGRLAVLLHGVQSSAATTARMARALAADGWNAVALDMPGHGGTAWLDGAEDRERYARARVAGLVGDAVAALGASPALIGHSWGADIALAIAASGRALERVVLIDPPVLTRDEAARYAEADIAELRPGDLEAARAVVAAEGTIPDALDAETKAQALTTVTPLAIEAVFLGGGMWRPQVDARRWRDAGQPQPLALIAADPDAGGYIPRQSIEELRSIVGDEHVHVLVGASHSPQRTDFDHFWPLLRSILG
jgi:pimeloyl-ACP methyl ester carboxylesterase